MMRAKTTRHSRLHNSGSLTQQARSPDQQHGLSSAIANPLQETIWQPDYSRSQTRTGQQHSGAGSFNFANVSVLPPNSPVQAKLTIGQPNDKYEQEADRVAEQVVGMPATSLVQPVSAGNNIVQRTCATCANEYSAAKEEDRPVEQGNLCPQCRVQAKPLADQITPLVQRQSDNMPEDEEEETLQTKPLLKRQVSDGEAAEDEEEETLQTKPVLQRQMENEEEEEETLQASTAPGHSATPGPGVTAGINAMRGGGQPLSPTVRHYMEPRFGQGFGQVRIHTDGNASQIAKQLGARAFTIGRNIAFGTGQYNPHSLDGKKLLAHELTHTVQQTGRQSLMQKPDVKQIQFPQKALQVNTQRQIGYNKSNTLVTPLIQLSPLSDELQQLWQAGNKAAFFQRMRTMGMSDPDVLTFIQANLVGDDLWLAENLFHHGTEANWPIHLRVEREMKGWAGTGGKGAVFNILRTAAGAEAANGDLTASLNGVFAPGSDDIWLALNLQQHGQETNWPIPVLIPPASVGGERVDFTGSHPMTAYGADIRINPRWVNGSVDHAVAYTKTVSPVVDAFFNVGNNLNRANIPSIIVRAKEGASTLGTSAPFAPGAANLTISALPLAGLSGSADVRQSTYNLAWEASVNGGATWGPITNTGVHPVYWLNGAPTSAPLYNMAASKATGYVAGSANVAQSIRTGLRNEINYDPADPINPDPLSVYADGVGICTDFANLLTLLAQSTGLNANTVMFWGGFQSLGKNIWASLGGAYGYINLVNVSSTNPAYNMPLAPISPLGWAFNYHAISRINGTLQDAALDITGINAQAAHAGKIVRLVEPSPNPMPRGKVGVAYNSPIQRKDHNVDVTVRDYGAKITNATFNDVYPIIIPPAAPSPYNAPVTWSMAPGNPLPAGLVLNPATGEITGTPGAQGVSNVNIRIQTPGGFNNTFAVTFTIDP